MSNPKVWWLQAKSRGGVQAVSAEREWSFVAITGFVSPFCLRGQSGSRGKMSLDLALLAYYLKLTRSSFISFLVSFYSLSLCDKIADSNKSKTIPTSCLDSVFQYKVYMFYLYSITLTYILKCYVTFSVVADD